MKGLPIFAVAISAMLIASLGGCATSREAQIRNSLLNIGLSTSVASCMAPPLARDLSSQQLQSLTRIAKIADGEARNVTEGQLLDIFRRDLDPKTLGVVIRTGMGCFLRG